MTSANTLLRIALALAVTIGSLAAQSSSQFTTPPGYLTKTGGFTATSFYDFLDGRTQLVEGGTAFNGRVWVIGRVSYRSQTAKSYFTNTGMGRNWTKVVVTVGPCNAAKISKSFTLNYLRTPSVVFSSKFSVPTLSGKPTQSWGNTGSFPFSSAYVKRKGEDMIHDYQWMGGTLANGATFSSKYELDSTYERPFISGPVTLMPPSVTCNDSFLSVTNGAAMTTFATSFSKNYVFAVFQNRIQITHSSRWTAGLAPVIHAASLGGVSNGVPAPGFGCNRLYINPATLIGLRTLKADQGTTARGAGILLPFRQIYVGVPIFFQGAWNDSLTGQPKLTQASKVVIPNKPSPGLERLQLYGIVFNGSLFGPFGPTGIGNGASTGQVHPVARFSSK